MNPSETAALGERLEAVRGRLAEAARIAGRKPEDVRLIAVSKLHPVEAILAAYGFGQRVFGENYVQEALSKQEALPDLDVEWHCIGHVQTNKAKDVTGRFALIHTVDNFKFAETLARRLPDPKARLIARKVMEYGAPIPWKRIVAELGNHWTVGKARYAYSRVCALCFAPRKRKGECHGLYCKTMPLPWNLPGLQEKGE